MAGQDNPKHCPISSNLEDLNLHNCELAAEALQMLQGLVNVKELALTSNNLQEITYEHFKGFPNLKSLCLSKNPQLTLKPRSLWGICCGEWHKILLKIHKHHHTSIALIYGVTEENHQRTNAFVRQFFPFAQSISAALDLQRKEKLSFYSYKLYVPAFDICPSGNLIQLTDEQCRLGRGCILLYNLTM